MTICFGHKLKAIQCKQVSLGLEKYKDFKVITSWRTMSYRSPCGGKGSSVIPFEVSACRQCLGLRELLKDTSANSKHQQGFGLGEVIRFTEALIYMLS